MTSPRSIQIDLSATSFYHCMTRCVRRAYLCGQDYQTGQDYSHRKQLIVARIKQLSSIFAIQICAYAVMSNHYHLVLFVNEQEAQSWDDEAVISRWQLLFSKDAKAISTYSKQEAEYKIALWRKRLMDISWFMRCLNEAIARSFNREDSTKGRFWEGRYKSQALLDEGAILSAMAYVDLNPIRAKVAKTPETSDYTSIQDRIHMLAKQLNVNNSIEKNGNQARQPGHLMPFANNHYKINKGVPAIDFMLSDYLQLIDSTGRIIREDKKGAIPDNIAPILTRLDLNARTWMNMVKSLQTSFSYAIGSTDVLMNFCSQHRRHGPKGLSTARQCYIAAA